MSQQFLVREIGGWDFVVERDEALDGAASGFQLLHQRREIILEQQHARARMVQDISKFDRRQPDIERHHDGVGQHHSVITFEQLVGVEAEIGDAVTRLDAVLPKRAGQALAAFAEFAIGKLASPADDSDFVRKQIHGAVKTPDGRQRNEHGGIVLLMVALYSYLSWRAATLGFLAPRASHFHLKIA